MSWPRSSSIDNSPLSSLIPPSVLNLRLCRSDCMNSTLLHGSPSGVKSTDSASRSLSWSGRRRSPDIVRIIIWRSTRECLRTGLFKSSRGHRFGPKNRARRGWSSTSTSERASDPGSGTLARPYGTGSPTTLTLRGGASKGHGHRRRCRRGERHARAPKIVRQGHSSLGLRGPPRSTKHRSALACPASTLSVGLVYGLVAMSAPSSESPPTRTQPPEGVTATCPIDVG